MTRCAAVVVVLLCLVGSSNGDEKPKPKRAWVGIMISLDSDKESIVIQSVLPDSPAEKAKLKATDVLVRINGAKPANLQAAVKLITALKPGKKAKFEISRDGKKKVIEVVPEEFKE